MEKDEFSDGMAKKHRLLRQGYSVLCISKGWNWVMKDHPPGGCFSPRITQGPF